MHTNYKLHKMKKAKNKTKQGTKLTENHAPLKVSSLYILRLNKTNIYIPKVKAFFENGQKRGSLKYSDVFRNCSFQYFRVHIIIKIF